MSLADDVIAASTTIRRRTWFDSLPHEAQSEFLEVRARWQGGQYAMARRTLARLVVAAARERGWKTCDDRNMAEWLSRNG